MRRHFVRWRRRETLKPVSKYWARDKRRSAIAPPGHQRAGLRSAQAMMDSFLRSNHPREKLFESLAAGAASRKRGELRPSATSEVFLLWVRPVACARLP